MRSQTVLIFATLGETLRHDDHWVEILQAYCVSVDDVHKPLLSISGCADMGFDCCLGDKGGYLLDKHSGEQILLERRDNLYVMLAWIRQDPGVNVSQPLVGPS